MELDIRDWMIVIGVLLFLAVVLDGYRRAQRERRHRVKLARSAGKVRFPQEDKEGFNELNVGSKRVVEHLAEPAVSPAPLSARSEDDDNDPLFTNPFEKKQVVQPEAPVQTQPEPVVEQTPVFTAPAIEPHFAETEVDNWQDNHEPVFTAAEVVETDITETLRADAVKPAIAVKTDHKKIDKKADTHKSSQVQLTVFDDEADAAHTEKYQEPEEILVMHVLANDADGFMGEDLLSILLGCDCRFGEMNIFHRYEAANGKGQVQFSVVNMVEPGIFVLDSIQEFTTPGVSLFMRLPGPKDPMEAFEAMVGVAQCIVKNLDGVLRDEYHNPMTEQTLEHERQRVRDYLQRRLRTHG